MGGGGSTTSRNISMEEDPNTGMIKVSEDVLRRMLGEDLPAGFTDKKEELDPQQHKKIEERWRSRLHNVERKWQDRLRNIEDKYADSFEINTEEFKKAAEEVEAKFIQQSCTPVCETKQAEVLKCFNEHPNQILKCSQLVKDFTECVDRARTVEYSDTEESGFIVLRGK